MKEASSERKGIVRNGLGSTKKDQRKAVVGSSGRKDREKEVQKKAEKEVDRSSAKGGRTT